MKKTILRPLALLLSAAMLFTACSKNTSSSDNAQAPSGESKGYKLKISYNGSLCEAPTQMADTLGFFAAEGLDYEMVRVDAAQMAEAVGSGKVDAGFGLLGKFMQPIVENGLDMKITAGIHTGCTRILVPQDSDIKTVADLKGKVVGTTGLGAAAPTIITRRALLHAGLDGTETTKDVEFKVFGGAELAQALENGAVDAIANSDPQAAIAQKEYNLRALVDTATTDDFKDEYCCISFVTGKTAQEHPEEAAKFTRAVLKAAQWVENHKDETAQLQIAKNWIAGEPESNAEVLKTYSYKPDINGGITALEATIPDLQTLKLISSEKSAKDIISEITYKPEGVTNDDFAGEIVPPNDPKEILGQ
ncbi:MAG: ABC transporter substrate-binding protein [Firmicutes bacterium]|nr:ABC transporter substrate-binding protein [Bacillota bacterium]